MNGWFVLLLMQGSLYFSTVLEDQEQSWKKKVSKVGRTTELLFIVFFSVVEQTEINNKV
jgi:hypothetical protein